MNTIKRNPSNANIGKIPYKKPYSWSNTSRQRNYEIKKNKCKNPRSFEIDFPLTAVFRKKKANIMQKLFEVSKTSILHTVFNTLQIPELGIHIFVERILEVLVRKLSSIPHQSYKINDHIVAKVATRIEEILEEVDRVKDIHGWPGDMNISYASPGSALLAGLEIRAKFAFDINGIWSLCDKAASLFRSKKIRPATCVRIHPGTYTCYPIHVLQSSTYSYLYVPKVLAPTYTSWFETIQRNLFREEQIHRMFRPPSQGGTSVSNIIGTGLCGGFQSDRRKKKKCIDDTTDVERKSVKIKDAESRIDITTMKPTYLSRDESAWLYGMPTIALSKINADVTFRNIEDNIEEKVEINEIITPTEIALSRIVNCPTMNHVIVRHLTTSERTEIDQSLWSCTETLRNVWIDFASTRRVDSILTREGLPCGCCIEIVTIAVEIASRALAIYECERQNSIKIGINEWTLSAFLIELICGTFTNGLLTSRTFEKRVNMLLPLFTSCAESITSAIKNIDTHNETITECERNQESNKPYIMPSTKGKIPNSFLFASAVSHIRQKLSRVSIYRKRAREYLSTWYFAPVKRLKYIHEVVDIAIGHNMFMRIEELLTAIGPRYEDPTNQKVHLVATKNKDVVRLYDINNKSYYPRKYVVSPDGERTIAVFSTEHSTEQTVINNDALVALLFPDDGTTWPCDVSWAASISSTRLGGYNTIESCGHLVPLSGRTSVLVFGPKIRGDIGEECSRLCCGGADPADAFLVGSMCEMMGNLHAKTLDCSLIYPFVYLVIMCGGRGKYADERYWQTNADTKTYASTRDGWDVLLRSSIAFIADRAWRISYGHNRQPMTEEDPGCPNDSSEMGFEIFPLIGRMITLAYAHENYKSNRLEWEREICRGLACVAVPKQRWRIKKDAIEILLAAYPCEMNDAKKLIMSSIYEDNEYIVVRESIDRMTRTKINVDLAIVSADNPITAETFLRNIELHMGLDEPPRLGLLSQYNPLSGYLSCIEKSNHSIDNGDQFCKIRHRRKRVGCTTVPSATRISSEFVRIINIMKSTDIRVANDVLKFLARIEYVLKIDSEDSCPKWTSIDIKRLKDVCIQSCNKHGVPICHMICTDDILSSSDFMPVADHPYSQKITQEILCSGCSQPIKDNIAELATWRLYMPPKDGPLMSELVHVRHGMIVLPHTFPSLTREKENTINYPMATIRELTRLYREHTCQSSRLPVDEDRSTIAYILDDILPDNETAITELQNIMKQKTDISIIKELNAGYRNHAAKEFDKGMSLATETAIITAHRNSDSVVTTDFDFKDMNEQPQASEEWLKNLLKTIN